MDMDDWIGESKVNKRFQRFYYDEGMGYWKSALKAILNKQDVIHGGNDENGKD